MSNNVDQIYVLSGSLTLTRQAAIIALREWGWPQNPKFPEAGFLADIIWNDRGNVDPREDPEDTVYEISHPWFYGDGSGRCANETVGSLQHTRGQAEIVVIYENGVKEGYRVNDGVVTQHKVVLSLGYLIE